MRQEIRAIQGTPNVVKPKVKTTLPCGYWKSPWGSEATVYADGGLM
jgi:hypothetical protein